ncbi:MAG: glycerophosphodiester phosphodiesterase [Chloroherpetonaceae bacterium]|nr:glycerophosphodiester phosphodiesterase [Chthonomonadaceae bacterium]MDW8207437.1 glycerophosphodiester phosphodiesterase [Chloroherpetonaceae bacterium]
MRTGLLVLFLAALLPAHAGAPEAPTPIVIAHRGASGLRPEHTLAAYELAIAQGADYLEPDLVMTRDGVLIARHENEISTTTDVASRPEFAARRTTKTIDGKKVTGWFTEDFTLAELKTLRVRERLPQLRRDSATYDGQFTIPTLEEILQLLRRRQKETGRVTGLYPETKHPSYFRQIGLPMEEKLAALLHRYGYRGRNAPVFIQSFEVANLKRLRQITDLPLVQLLDERGQPYDFQVAGDSRTYADLATPQGLAQIATYAQGIGPAKGLILPRDPTGRWKAPTTLVTDAHAAGLKVHPWTFRDEKMFLPADCPDAVAEIRRFLQLGVDGVFTDFPATAVRARNSLQKMP